MGKFKNLGEQCISLVLAFAVVFTSVFSGIGITAQAAGETEEPYVVSAGRPVYASSEKAAASYAVDGDAATRWESEYDSENEWIYVDLGKVTKITGMYLKWEAACATKYRIQFSDDEVEWKDVHTVTDGAAEERNLDVAGNARYVRVYCDEKAMPNFGYSIYEFQVLGLDGLTPRPVDYGVNLALNQPVSVSSVQKEWWMIKKDENGNEVKDENGNPVYDQTNVLAENAVDGNRTDRAWHSSGADANKRVDDQWLYVDLGEQKEIGRITIDWQDAARAYQIQVSDDAENWTTIYAKMNDGAANKNLPIYAKGRYVRIYCLASWGFNGFGIKELQVFAYREGEEKITYEKEIETIPEIKTETVSGSGATYATDDVRFPMAKPPIYLEESLQMPNQPVASNDWWQSMTIKEIGDGLVSMPFRTKHSANGLEIVEVNDCWYGAADQRIGALGSAIVNSKTDISITPEGMDTSVLYDKVIDYSDYSVTAQLCDKNGVVMTNTITKGSPYLFSEFGANQDIVIYSGNITSVFDDKAQEILKEQNKEVILDHFGLEITDDDNKAKTKTAKSYFSINLPENTTVSRAGNKIKIHFPAANGYISVGAMTKKSDLPAFYQHGYAFIRNTSVTYDYDEDTSKVTTYFKVTTELKRKGFSEETMQCLLPHQWKTSDAAVSENLTYTSQRGTLKAMTGNQFETVDTFYGMVPQFTTPQNDGYDSEILTSYLAQIEKDTHDIESLPGGDAYWQGKSIHPLALATLVADQSGNAEYKEMFIERLRYIFEDWFTYSGPEDEVYFYYDKNWGTLYYRYSEFGANTGICDHHFTYGYFLFAASVLATYDDGFYEEYKEILDLMVRDFASPYEDDDMFCRFRSFDLYEGHSWAGGYADNSDGNNQEAGGESLFGWVGMYLWAIRSGNTDFRDAAIFGFTTELNDVKQYWFNYDGDNWPEDWPHYIVGQNYGATLFYGTFFDGNATSVYGIHWLPVAEWITHFGMEQEQLQTMYEGLLKEIDGQRAIEQEKFDTDGSGSPDSVKTTLSDWQHLFVPLRSQYDPDGALEDYWKAKETYTHSTTEEFNTYWFANNMKDLGVRTYDIYPIGGASASVYESRNTEGGEKTYTAIAWNPTNADVKIQFTDGSKIVGSATIGAKSLVRFNPLEKDLVQVSTPEFSVSSDVYEDTQYVKITTGTEGAAIYYTTDGSNPTSNSAVYSGRIPVSSTTTIKAVAVKDGYIDSALQSVTIQIDSGCITTGINIANGKQAEASSAKGGNTADKILDQNAATRWESEVGDDEWCSVDLGQNYEVNKVKISWEAAYATKYKIQVSIDNENWQDVYAENAGNGGIDEAIFDVVTARYVRMQGMARATDYGYSIYEMGVYEARKISTPQFSLAEGSYTGNQLLSIASGTRGVEIRYTTDGSEPDENSLLYIPQLTVWQSGTIKAKAFKKGMIPSETAEAAYQITGGSKPEEADTYDESDSFMANPQDPDIEEETLAGEAGEAIEDSGLKSCISYGKEVTVSSSENDNTKQNITDGNLDTVWSSAWQKPGSAEAMENEERYNQWCMIDLGESTAFNEVKIHWVTVNNQYQIQISDDKENWTPVYTWTNATADNKIDVCRFDTVSARYVKMQGIAVGDAWGYSLREMMVYLSEEEQPLGANVAANASVSASSGAAGNLNDGKLETAWQPEGEENASIEIDLYKTYQIDKVILNGTESYTGKITIETAAEPGAWQTAVDSVEADSLGTYKFEAAFARYVRVTFTGGTDALSVKELEVYTCGSADVAPVEINYYEVKGTGASSEQGAHPASNIATDRTGGYWQAETKEENEWCYIDLGESREVNIVSIDWEGSCAAVYDIYLTDSIENWDPNTGQTKAYEGATASGAGVVETVLTNPKTARYVVMQARQGSENAKNYGVAMYEMKAGLRVPIPVERIEVSPKSVKLSVGGKADVVCIVSPSNADCTDVVWNSDRTDVATVTSQGEIRAKAAGTAKITVSAVSDETKYAEIEVSVAGPMKIARPKAAVTGNGEITVSWTAVETAAGYDIYRATSQNGKYTKLNDTLLTEASYRDTGLKSGRYFYKIEAVGQEGSLYQSSGLSMASLGVSITETQPEKEQLAAPMVTAAAADGSVTLTWTAVEHADSYEVYRASQENKTYTKLDSVQETTYHDSNLESGTYYYKVIARAADQSAWEDSEYSDVVEVAVTKTTSGGDGTGGSTEEKPGGGTGGSTEEKPGGGTGGSTEQKVLVSKIQLTSTVNVAKGSTVTIKPAVTPQNASNQKLVWSTSDKKIATVDAAGKVKGLKYGVVTITAAATDGSNVKATCKVRVGYKITYKLNKGKNNKSNQRSYYKQKVKLKNPARKGYIFKGWYTDKKFKKKITSIKSTAKKNYTLYAKWEKVKVDKTQLKKLTSPKKSQIKVTAGKVSKAAGYEVICAADKKFKKDKKVVSGKKTSLTVQGLKAGKKYYVKLRAYKLDSTGKKVYGAYTKTSEIVVKK